MDDERLLKVVRLLYPSARHVALAPVAAGRIAGEEAEQGFIYASLYDHKVGSQMRPVGDRLVIVNNTYLASHAYNIALCHLVGAAQDKDEADLVRLYRHNLKKFFAEQVVFRRNVLIGRAMLIETLLYEQDLMRDAFAGVAAHGLAERARAIADIASGTVSQHELTHYFERRDPSFDENYRAEIGTGFEDIEEAVYQLGGAELRTEFRCDLSAVRLTLKHHQGFDKSDLLRAQLFVFYVLAELVSLTKSAAATADNAVAEEAHIDLSAVDPAQHAFAFQLGRDRDFDVRVDAVEKVLLRIGEAAGIRLFSDDGGFPLHEGTRDLLRSAQDRIGETAPAPVAGLTGTDDLRRGLAQILAESLKGADDGVALLLWRSKVLNKPGELRFGA